MRNAVLGRFTEKAKSLKENWDALDRNERARAVQEIVNGSEGDVSRHQLAEFLGVHHSAVNRLYDLEIPEGPAPGEPIASKDGVKQTTRIKGDILDVDLTSYRICNVDQLIEYCQINLDDWQFIEGTINKWEVGAAQKSKSVYLEGKRGNRYIGYEVGDTKIVVEPLFQVKARFKKKAELISARAEIAALVEEWKSQAPVYVPIVHDDLYDGCLLEINLTDHHFGKLAWAPETGQDYDIKIAERLFDEGVDAALQRAKGYGIALIVFSVGNDLLHFDNLENATTAGTIVTADSRFQKVYRTVRKAVVRNVEKCREVAPVRIIMVPGNHDSVSTVTLGELLEVQFANCPDVTIDSTPRYRKYMQFGKCMIMWTHGNKGKLESYPILMAADQPKMWGDTVYREAHTGDKHHRKVLEVQGVAVRILPTLCAADDWHAEMQFVNNIRCSESFLWHPEQGMIGTFVHNLPAEYQLSQVA